MKMANRLKGSCASIRTGTRNNAVVLSSDVEPLVPMERVIYSFSMSDVKGLVLFLVRAGNLYAGLFNDISGMSFKRQKRKGKSPFYYLPSSFVAEHGLKSGVYRATYAADIDVVEVALGMKIEREGKQ